HDQVVEGSAQVTRVVRDRVTGNTLARIPQSLGVDVSVKEFEGRLQFTRPIASVWDDGGLIGNGSLKGHPVDIEVDYETPGRAGEKTAMGGRVTQAVGDKLTLGTTIVDDGSGDGDYRLRGTDAARSGLAAELEERHTARVMAAINHDATAAVRYWYKPAESVKATLEHQHAFATGGDSQSALALEWRALSMLALEARGATGEHGGSLRGGATLNLNGRQVYVREQRANGLTGERNSTLF